MASPKCSRYLEREMDDPRIEEIRNLLPRAMLRDWVRLGSRLVRVVRDRAHAGKHDPVLQRLLDQARASAVLRTNRAASLPVIEFPATLPITGRREEIVAAIRKHQVVVIGGETGSGKTTQLPKMCLEAGCGIEAMIGCTQPRRIAALSISQRIADEMNVSWGKEVGCKIRFDDRSSPETYIKLMTDGILLAEMQGDPLLSDYNAIIIDEAHERSLNIDFLLGHLKTLLRKRADLKLIVTSATIDLEGFARAFDDAPIIEVSGRMYPVEVIYAPLDAQSEETGELTVIDAAARAVEQVITSAEPGDVLVFMPTERDIRETADLLRARIGDIAEIMLLFGRLSSGDQQRVFASAAKRKVIIATNIAETSLTIPGIRYVIDSGLARMSRYNPRTRTKRLPIEPIAQSSANQRKGRSGRVQNGVCIRLYSEEEFSARPAFTQPEIQRANLAEVILRMKAFRLGEIETFPFLNPPTPAAIAGGYKLLQELGALDEQRTLTPMGDDLARLPIDPTLGRMLLQAQKEHATRELLIIASGLAIQDPRERPLEQKDAATTAHNKFAHPDSDFLTLLNIWNAVHEEWERLRTQNQRRKFCRAHFLSYLRMREWQDLHAQLEDALSDLGRFSLNESNAHYEAVHRSILAGLLAHIGRREGRNVYKGPGNRELVLFPGSALARRAPPQKPRREKRQPNNPEAPSAGQPEWIVAGEVVETSQLFARTVAGIDPLWVIELAPHLCKRTYENPHWSPGAGQVMALERTTFAGLDLQQRKVAYGRIDPAKSTAIFIRSALVEEHLFPEEKAEEADEKTISKSQLNRGTANPESRQLPARFAFLEHNRKIRQKIEVWQTRSRRHDLGSLDDALFEFYSKHLQNISSIHELNQFLGGEKQSPRLYASEKDLIGDIDLDFDSTAFPDSIVLQGESVPLSYAYRPGEEQDGVTLRLGFSLAQSVPGASLEWAVPGLRESLVLELLRSLPKSIRRELMPLPPKVTEIVNELKPTGTSLKEDLRDFLRRRYGVQVGPNAWPADAVPAHLLPRIEVTDQNRRTLGATRNPAELPKPTTPPAPSMTTQDTAFGKCAGKWEKFGLTAWTIGDLPERVTISEGPPPQYAWPGLQAEEGHVNLRLFRTAELAAQATPAALRVLATLALQKDFAWLQKDLRAVAGLQPLAQGLCTVEELQEMAFQNLKRHLLHSVALTTLTRAGFETLLARIRENLPGLAFAMADRLKAVLGLRHEILRRFGSPAPSASSKPAKATLSSLQQLAAVPAAPRLRPEQQIAATELAKLLPADFLLVTPYERLEQLPRYLKALLIRAERAALNPAKDQERARQLAPFLQALQEMQAQPQRTAEKTANIQEFRWAIEEFKVSLFAQELGTAFPVSAKRLEQQFQTLLRL